MPKFIQNGSQFSGVAVSFLGSNSWVGVAPVDGQAVIPKVLTLQNVSWFNTRVETMHFTSIVGHANLKMGVITSQPGEKEEDGNQHTDKNKKNKTKKPTGNKAKKCWVDKTDSSKAKFLSGSKTSILTRG